jgi:hypothetical protein
MTRVAAAVILMVAVLAGCKKEEKQAAAPPAPGTTEWKILNAMSAGPEYVVSGAKLQEFVPTDTAMRVLREGTNDWTCFTDDPNTPANDPSCSDDEAMKWFDAFLAHLPPRLTGMGVAYALQGAQLASLSDPYKQKPDSGQAWVDIPPAIFIMMPDARAYRGLPTAPTSGKPWVLYAGTPYWVLVVPAAAPGSAAPAPAAPAKAR